MTTVKKITTTNSKFWQKWLTVVHVNSSAIYLIWCGTTMVLQVMPFLQKFPKRYRAFRPTLIQTD
ncbi:hypothetical protein ACVWYG_000419 [Pedobacter sp. UYEF25]